MIGNVGERMPRLDETLSRRDTMRATNVERARDVETSELSTPVIAGCLVGLQLELSYEVT